MATYYWHRLIAKLVSSSFLHQCISMGVDFLGCWDFKLKGFSPKFHKTSFLPTLLLLLLLFAVQTWNYWFFVNNFSGFWTPLQFLVIIIIVNVMRFRDMVYFVCFVVLYQDAQDYADIQDAIFIETSAKNAINVSALFLEISMWTFMSSFCSVF